MKQYPKIDFYSGLRYLFSTTQSPSCSAAMKRFLKTKTYQGTRKDGTLGKCTWIDDNSGILEARINKS